MSPVTPRALNERLSYAPSTMIGARRFFSVRSSRTRCKSSWSCSQSIGSLTERPADDKGCAQEAIIYRPPDMRIVPGEEEVNFERVTKVYREESGKKTLVALEADFYDKLASYIARLDESANKEAQKDPNSPKALLLQDELRKVRNRRAQPQGPRPGRCAGGPASVRGDRYNIPAEKRGRGHTPEDDRGNPCRPRESTDRPNGRWPTVIGSTGVHFDRFGVIVLAAFTIGLPVLVLIALAMGGNGPNWPYVPILSGSCVIVVLILRAAVRSKILFSEGAHVRDIAQW